MKDMLKGILKYLPVIILAGSILFWIGSLAYSLIYASDGIPD